MRILTQVAPAGATHCKVERFFKVEGEQLSFFNPYNRWQKWTKSSPGFALFELRNERNANGLPAVGFPACLAEEGREVDVLCHAKFNDVDVAIVQDGPMPRICLAAAFEGYRK